LTAQEKRLVQRLEELRRAADRIGAFDRLDARLLCAIVTYGIFRVRGIPSEKDTVRDMKQAVKTLVGATVGGAWWDDYDDRSKPETRTSAPRKPRPARRKKAGQVIHFAKARARILARRRTERRNEP
jgi:hypothetical protein